MALLRLPALVLSIVAACATAGKDPGQPGDAANDASLTVDANNCANQPCDILTQCGCAANAACDIDGADLNGGACRMVAGTAVGEGGACSNSTGCQGGTVCLGNPGVCKKYCDANTDCGQPRGQCVLEINSGGTPIPNIPKACSSTCDPVNVVAGACPTNMKCGLFTQTGNINVVDCAAVTTAGAQGANCGPAPGNDALCGPNFLCTTIDNNVSFQCRHVCIRPGNTGCVGAQTCLSLGAAPGFVVAGTEYGACN